MQKKKMLLLYVSHDDLDNGHLKWQVSCSLANIMGEGYRNQESGSYVIKYQDRESKGEISNQGGTRVNSIQGTRESKSECRVIKHKYTAWPHRNTGIAV
jgi:hypothetical protein